MEEGVGLHSFGYVFSVNLDSFQMSLCFSIHIKLAIQRLFLLGIILGASAQQIVQIQERTIPQNPTNLPM